MELFIYTILGSLIVVYVVYSIYRNTRAYNNLLLVKKWGGTITKQETQYFKYRKLVKGIIVLHLMIKRTITKMLVSTSDKCKCSYDWWPLTYQQLKNWILIKSPIVEEKKRSDRVMPIQVLTREEVRAAQHEKNEHYRNLRNIANQLLTQDSIILENGKMDNSPLPDVVFGGPPPNK